MTVDLLRFLVVLLFPAVCFYFSLCRMGAFNLFNRAVYIINYSLILLAVILGGKKRISKNGYILLALCVVLCSVGNIVGVNALDGKYAKAYSVPENYVYTDAQDDLPRLGKGFVKKDLMEGLENAAKRFSKFDRAKNYYALFSNGDHGMGYDSCLDIKGAGLLEGLLVRSYSVAKKNAEQLLRTKAIVGKQISPVDHYYFYKWLMTGGNYIYSEENEVFYPVENQSRAEIEEANAKVIMNMPSVDVGRLAATLGNSKESLLNVLRKMDFLCVNSVVENEFCISFEEPLSGDDIDFIFVSAELPSDKTFFIMGEEREARNRIERRLMKCDFNRGMKIVVSYKDDFGNEFFQKADAQNGKLLVPIGSANRWLCNSHGEIRIHFEKDGAVIPLPQIKGLEFYKARPLVLN